MKQRYPIFTVDAECQDCYKCVRNCPVKAIKIENGKAKILSELCIACGHCVQVCPSHAKHIRNDVNRVRLLMEENKKVIVSLAPSYRREFNPEEQKRIITVLKHLGFYGVSETALGAEQLSIKLSEDLKSDDVPNHLLISSACPAAVDFIYKYLPQFSKNISTNLSPVQCHARQIKNAFGDDTIVVFIGPCVAKKDECDHASDYVNVSITFLELRNWLETLDIDFMRFKTDEENGEHFLLSNAAYSTLYPIEAGMIRTIEDLNINANYLAVSGVDEIRNTLQNFDLDRSSSNPRNTFLEVLACKGSCINGPCMSKNRAKLDAEIEIWDHIKIKDEKHRLTNLPHLKDEELGRKIFYDDFDRDEISEKQIVDTLHSLNKFEPKDELNCGGCGYNDCRTFAKAIIRGKAEREMCLSYLRKQAQQKTNALMHHIPAGLVLVNRDLKIVESNKKFTEIFNEDLEEILIVNPTLEGMLISKLIPIGNHVERVFNTHSCLNKTINFQNRIYDIILFPVTQGSIVGIFIQDVTNTEMHHEEIAKLAQEVIHKNLESVQEIAMRLGENMAETEILLRTIARGFKSEKLKKLNDDIKDGDDNE